MNNFEVGGDGDFVRMTFNGARMNEDGDNLMSITTVGEGARCLAITTVGEATRCLAITTGYCRFVCATAGDGRECM